MPLFRRTPPPEPPANPDDWRPQRFGRGGRFMRDAIIEPSWNGVRILARFEDGLTRLIDEDGADCTAEFAAVADAITTAALAGELILDGFLTVEPTQVVVGMSPEEIGAPTSGQMMAQWIVGSRVGSRVAGPETPERHLDPDRPIAFVAVDLLEIDGSRLLDIPLLERKRLLEGALQPGELVRITPFVRPPIGSFVATWRGVGFRALVYKAANSRYTPDVRNDDWSIVSMPSR
jgi:ATP-dependent DNA ligase